jgi:tetratricopeptide (TPR) repeat protein
LSAALTRVDRALALDPDSVPARTLRGKIEAGLRAAAEREEAAERALREQREAIAAGLAKAKAAASHVTAIGFLRDVLEIDPEHTEAQALLTERQEAQVREETARSRADQHAELGEVVLSANLQGKATEPPAARASISMPAVVVQQPREVARPAVLPAKPAAGRRRIYAMAGAVAGVLLIATLVFISSRRGPVEAPGALNAPRLPETPVPSAAPPAAPAQPAAEPAAAAASSPADRLPSASNSSPPVTRSNESDQVQRLRNLAAQQFARGNKEQGLATASSALRLQPRDQETLKILANALAQARSEVARARATANNAGRLATESSSFQLGTRRDQEAGQLERAGRLDEALRSEWQAANLFTSAAEAGRSASQSPTVTPPPPTPVTPPASGATPVEVRPVERPQPSDVTPSAPAGPPPVASRPAETTSPPRVTPPDSPPPAPPPPVVSDEAAVRAVLQAYAAAYSSLDAGAVKRVFPSVDENTLRQRFSAMRSQSVQIQDLQIAINGAAATATCTWATVFTGQVGGTQRSSPKVELRMQKSAGGWVIVSRR